LCLQKGKETICSGLKEAQSLLNSYEGAIWVFAIEEEDRKVHLLRLRTSRRAKKWTHFSYIASVQDPLKHIHTDKDLLEFICSKGDQ